MKKLLTILIHFTLAVALIAVSYHLHPGFYHWALGLFLYLLVLLVPYRIIPRFHVKGMKYLEEEKFDLAFAEFEKSRLYFERNKNLDRFGFILLLNASPNNYRESSILNQAFIHFQQNKPEEARALYALVLDTNPKSKIAQKGIAFIQEEFA